MIFEGKHGGQSNSGQDIQPPMEIGMTFLPPEILYRFHMQITKNRKEYSKKVSFSYLLNYYRIQKIKFIFHNDIFRRNTHNIKGIIIHAGSYAQNRNIQVHDISQPSRVII